MRKRVSIVTFLCVIVCFSFYGIAECKRGTSGPKKNSWIKVEGKRLLTAEGKEFLLKGISFGNQVWSNPGLPSKTHHSEKDYAYIKSLGFNSVRFYLNYGLFEDDARPFVYKKTGWDWINKNIAWARKNNIYLVLNMHVPHGGHQSNAQTIELWKRPDYQKRFLALWKKIAERVKSEPVIAGYSILNEPGVFGGINTWKHFSRETVRTIRNIDRRHIIFVERMQCEIKAIGNSDWNENVNGDMNFVKLDDKNIVYEFHFYKPLPFTHQGAPWIPAFRDRVADYPGKMRDWDGTLKMMDRAFLEKEIGRYVAFSRKYKVPLYLGEFGTITNSFKDGRHGASWVTDMLDLCLKYRINFNYHTFHEEPFGLYQNAQYRAPSNLNKALEEVFRGKLRRE